MIWADFDGVTVILVLFPDIFTAGQLKCVRDAGSKKEFTPLIPPSNWLYIIAGKSFLPLRLSVKMVEILSNFRKQDSRLEDRFLRNNRKLIVSC